MTRIDFDGLVSFLFRFVLIHYLSSLSFWSPFGTTGSPFFYSFISNTMTSSSSSNNNNNNNLPRNQDLLALKQYITAQDHSNPYIDGRLPYQTLLLIDMTHSNLQQRHVEQRFYRHDTIAQVKESILLKTGTPPHFQRLQLKIGGRLIQEIPAAVEESSLSSNSSSFNTNMDHYQLGYFFVTNYSPTTTDTYSYQQEQQQEQQHPTIWQSLQIHCIDMNPHSMSRGGQLEDTSLITKYRMSDEDYQKRPGTLLDWSRQQQAKDATFTLTKHAKQHLELCEAQRCHRLGLSLPNGFVLDATTGKVIRKEENINEDDNQDDSNSKHQDLVDLSITDHGEMSVAHITIGQRCQVEPGQRRGIISYVGPVPELSKKSTTTTNNNNNNNNNNNGSYWVGVTFDEPVGKSNGTVAGKQYFDTLPNYGGFVRGKNVQVGDFPERDILNDDDDDEL
jgi:tubulin-specific chaperone B